MNFNTPASPNLPPVQPGRGGPQTGRAARGMSQMATMIFNPGPSPASNPIVSGLMAGNNHGTGLMNPWTLLNGPRGGL